MNSHITKLIKKIPLLICFSFISDIVSLSQESWKCRHPALHGALSLPPSSWCRESPLEPQGSPGVVGRFVRALGHQRYQGEGRIFLWHLHVAHSSFVGQGKRTSPLPKENRVPDAGMEPAFLWVSLSDRTVSPCSCVHLWGPTDRSRQSSIYW